MRRTCCILLTLALTLAGRATLASEAKAGIREKPDEVAQFLAQVAETLARELKGLSEHQVVLNFTPAAGKSAAGKGLEERLTPKLKDEGIAVVAAARYTFKCEFGKAESIDGAPVLKFAGSLVNAQGKPVGDVPVETQISDERALDTLLGLTIPDQFKARTAKDKNRLIDDAISRPKFWLAGFTAKTQSSSPFGVEIAVRGRPISIKDRDGFASFELGLNDEYEIRLSNSADFEVAASVTIDGLSSYFFATENNPTTGKPYKGIYILAPAQNGQPTVRTVNGWFKSARVSKGFRAVPLEESAAAQLGLPTESIGQLTVTFHSSFETGVEDQTVAAPPPGKFGSAAGGSFDSQPPKVSAAPPTADVPKSSPKPGAGMIAGSSGPTLGSSGPTLGSSGPKLGSTGPAPAAEAAPGSGGSVAIGTGVGSSRLQNVQSVDRTIGVIRDSITLHYVGRR